MRRRRIGSLTGRDIAPRYQRVLRLLLEGKPDKEIASVTGLTLHTVRTYVKEVFRALGVRGRVHLLSRALNRQSGR